MKLLLRERLTFLSRVPGLLVYICFIIVDVMTDACTMFLNFIAVKLFRKYFYIDIILHIYIYSIYIFIYSLLIRYLFYIYIFFSVNLFRPFHLLIFKLLFHSALMLELFWKMCRFRFLF